MQNFSGTLPQMNSISEGHKKAAAHWAAQFIQLFPTTSTPLNETFIAGVTALFASYSEVVLKYACNPVSGIPSRFKFLPTIAELKTELGNAAATIERDRERAATPPRVFLPKPPQRLESEAERLARLDVEYKDCYWGSDEDIQPGDRVAGIRSKGAGSWQLKTMTPEDREARPKLRYSDWYKAKSISIPSCETVMTSNADLGSKVEDEVNPFL